MMTLAVASSDSPTKILASPPSPTVHRSAVPFSPSSTCIASTSSCTSKFLRTSPPLRDINAGRAASRPACSHRLAAAHSSSKADAGTITRPSCSNAPSHSFMMPPCRWQPTDTAWPFTHSTDCSNRCLVRSTGTRLSEGFNSCLPRKREPRHSRSALSIATR